MTREEELEALAAAHGWTFSIEDPEDLLRLPFHFFRDGVAHGVSDVIEGAVEGRDVVGFDYEWRIVVGGAAEAPMTLDTSCAVVALPADCPEVMVSHETTAHWLAHPLHHRVFESKREDFARAFRVTTTHEDFAARVLDEPMERWFLEAIPDHDLCFEIAGPWLLCFTRRRDPAFTPTVMGAAVEVAGRIPAAAFEGLPVPPA